MATVQRASMIQYPDGQVAIHNIRKKRPSIPVFGPNESYSATLVNSWWDGTPMDDSKADGNVYFKLKKLPSGADTSLEQYVGSYFRLNLPNEAKLFLEKDTMQEMRDLNSTEILLLQMGYYKGVKLNGYYTKGDTPSPIEYSLSTTSSFDDGGSVIEVGSIKLEHDFVNTLNVKYFGIFADGVERTLIINSTLAYGASRGLIVEFSDGEYLIDSAVVNNVRGVVVPSNSKINTSQHTVFKSTPQSGGNYAIFSIRNASNISINRLVLIGERDEHTGGGGEWGMGLSITTASDVEIGYLECSNCWGDGLYLGKVVVGETNSNIKIHQLIADNNRRQGASIITADGLFIGNAKISNTSGTAPQAGIDFEPNHPEDMYRDVVINNLVTSNNTGGGVIYVSLQSDETTLPVDITINNHRSYNEFGFATTGARSSRVKGLITFNNFKSENAPIYGIHVRNYVNQPDLTFNNPVILNPNRDGRGDDFGSGIYITRESSDTIPEGAYHPSIKLIKPTVKNFSGTMRRGIYVNNTTANPDNVIRNVYIENPVVENASASPLVYQSNIDIIDTTQSNTRIQLSSNYSVPQFLSYTAFSNLGSSSDIRVQVGALPHYSGSKFKIRVDSPSRFGIQFLNGGYFQNLGPSYVNIRSNTVGSYIVVRCVNPSSNIWNLEEIIGVWEIGVGKILTTFPRREALLDERGLVLQSTAVSGAVTQNIPASDAESTATTLEDLLTDFNDLVSKYNALRLYCSENRTQLNAKLAADRASGQQSV